MMNTTLQLRLGLLAIAVIAGCGESNPGTSAQTSSEDEPSAVLATPDEPRTAAMEGFSWLVDGELAAMPLPGRHRDLEEDVNFLRMEGVRTLVSLTETPPDAEVLAASEISQVLIPVRDFTAPTLEQMTEFVDVVNASVERGDPVGVHCTAGLGRSGTMAAAYLVAQGASAEEAIATVRGLRPGSIETEAQEEAVTRYEAHARGSQ